MTRKLAVALLVLAPAAAHAQPTWESVGSRVGVRIEVEGASAPLYCAPDGSGRYYFEARTGARYTVHLDNHSAERLGVRITVDGLNVISGQLESVDGGGRLYVLSPWAETAVSGWRTSLSDVRRFTFVDERASYAVRSGKDNGKLGWIEVAVYRERKPAVASWPWSSGRVSPPADAEARREAGRDAPAAKAADPAPGTLAPEDSDRLRSLGYVGGAPAQPQPRNSYPGTGWGAHEYDRVEVVDFQPEPTPVERTTLRYEYAQGLVALGIWPRPWPPRDRLSERDRGNLGFAQPPRP